MVVLLARPCSLVPDTEVTMRPTISHLEVGAPPNFMKVARLWHALSAYSCCQWRTDLTGQNYDVQVSPRFYRDLISCATCDNYRPQSSLIIRTQLRKVYAAKVYVGPNVIMLGTGKQKRECLYSENG
jgi:hypothetical protein